MEKAAKEVAKAISIHSLRMEGDCSIDQRSHAVIHFNPLPPHGGRLLATFFPAFRASISIHSLRMEGDVSFASQISTWKSFQSTPSAWRETWLAEEMLQEMEFQSTPSAWRETRAWEEKDKQRRISIHSLRMEGDFWPPCHVFCGTISIHSLRMEGDYAVPDVLRSMFHFNPLPPHGGRRSRRTEIGVCGGISIHSLRMEGDG